nr:hypothetical protein [Streptomyces hygroscopicus]
MSTPTARSTSTPSPTGSPRMLALPVSGDDRPTSIRIVEVLPAPFGPSSAQI